jgi:APA family basic amino acid/polyamine antiporter
MNFVLFGLSASCLFVLRERERRNSAAPRFAGFRAPWHPFSTGAFILAAVAIVGCSLWSDPVDSLIGFGILLLGVGPYLLWRRRAALLKAPATA